MKRKVIFIILIIIFLSQVNVEAAGVYIGSFTPKQDENFRFFIPIREIDSEVITLSTQDNYFRSENKKIGSVNLKLINRNRELPLSTKKVSIEKNDLLHPQSLNFSLDLKAEYEPGLYKNLLFIEDGNKYLEMEIIFEIRPWRELSNGTVQNAKIENLDRRTMELLSSGQQKLVIRSNTDWKLKVLIDEKNLDNLSIRTAADSQSRSVLNYKNDFVRLDTVETIIADGSNTAALSADQAEIFYQLKIEDFRKIQAGDKNYQLKFILE